VRRPDVQQTTGQPDQGTNPLVSPALKARSTFIPELERVFRRQVQILDRVVVNFSVTANELLGTHQVIRPGDTWESLRPLQHHLFPNAVVYRDLSASDTELLAEFYGAVNEVADLILRCAETVALTEYNAWNILMHKVEHSLRMGELACKRSVVIGLTMRPCRPEGACCHSPNGF
jgi:hypothetical protein